MDRTPTGNADRANAQPIRPVIGDDTDKCECLRAQLFVLGVRIAGQSGHYTFT
jgi:hypothetical protein